MSTIADFTAKDSKGNDVNLGQYLGKVVLVVNVASKCGFTPQYKELSELYSKYKDKGLEILAFPCNQFGWQEPGKLLSFDILTLSQVQKMRFASSPRKLSMWNSPSFKKSTLMEDRQAHSLTF
jgi:glutathione peroxidase-family protein